MKIRKKLLFSFMMLGLLAACGETKENTTNTTKDTLVFSQISEGKTLDPQDTTEQYSQRVITVIYDRLVEIDEMTGKIVPGLAKSWEQLDDNTILFHLNEGITFHNGNKFSAEDVKFTLERAKKLPKVAHLYSLIDNIEVVDDNTVKIHTSEPFAPLLAHLSHKTASIISKKYFEEKGEEGFHNPVGTGPYKYKDWKVGDRITLEANDNYFGEKPSIKYVVIRAIPEENSSVIGLETGEIDMTADLNAESRRLVMDNPELVYMEQSGISVNYVGLNTTKGILKDKDVRKAIAMGINRDIIIDSVLMGAVEKANSLLGPGVVGYSKDTKPFEYNPAEAKKLLNEAGYETLDLTIVTSNNDLRKQMAEIMQAQLKEIGINIKIEILEWATFLNTTGNGKSDLFMIGWSNSSGDADYGLTPMLHSSMKGNSGNRSFFDNKEFDTLLEEGKVELNPQKRAEIYARAQDVMNREVPILPIYFMPASAGIRKEVKGFVQSPINNPTFYKLSF